MMYSKASTESSEDLIPVLNSDSQMTIEEESGRSYVVLAEPRKKTLFSSDRCKRSYLVTSTVVSVVLLLLVIWLGVFNGNNYTCKDHNIASEICTSQGCVKAAYKLLSSYDNTVDPCQDFFKYSCGGWLAKNRIPDNKTSWSVDTVLLQDNLDTLRDVLENDATDKLKSMAEKEAISFYRSCTDSDRRNKLKEKPLVSLMKKFGVFSYNMKGRSLTEKILILQQKFSLPTFFHLQVSADDKNSTRHAIKLNQAGIVLPRKKYLANNTNEILKAYVDMMTRINYLVTKISGRSVRNDMIEVMELERNISKIYVPMEKMTQIDEVYKKMTIKDLQKLCPLIDWLYFFRKLFTDITDIKPDYEVIVYTSDFFKKLTNVINNTPPRTLANFFFWKVIHAYSPFLSDEFAEARKAFVKVLLGSSGSEPLWKECIAQTDDVIGMAVGAMFVRKTFPKSSKDEVAQMVVDIRRAFIEHLTRLKWMDPQTQYVAQMKANAMKEKIGFPTSILDAVELDKMYKGLRFDESNYFQNHLRKNSYEMRKMLKKIVKVVDRKEWLMTPSTINAYYNPSFNEIVFPAGILQSPFYNKEFPKSVNFGGIGAIIGHELVHGFDNDGRLYDKNGNYGKTWWSRKASTSFKRMSKCFIDEYSKFVLFGKNLNGKVTLGENIADNGGLKAAYIAYRRWIKQHGEEKRLPGIPLTNEQAFFVSYGQSWCSHQRRGKALYQLDTDTHSPAQDRVIGTVSNIPEFAKAFNCPVGSAMNPLRKCGIW